MTADLAVDSFERPAQRTRPSEPSTAWYGEKNNERERESSQLRGEGEIR